MGDLLEHGAPRRRRPRWLPAGLALLVVGVGTAYVGARPGGLLSSPGPAPTATSRATRPPAPQRTPAELLLPEWPERPGACGNQVFVPVLAATPLRERTRLRVLVGGHGLRSVDVDTGATRWVGGADVRRRQVTSLARAGGGTFAIGARCSTTSATGQLLRVAGRGAVTVAQHADLLLTGAGAAWHYRSATAPGHGVTLQSVAGGRRTPMPREFGPIAATSRYFVGSFYAGLLPDDLPQVAVLRRSAPRRLRTLGQGVPFAVTGAAAVSSRGCGAGAPCVLQVMPLSGGPTDRVGLPGGRSPTSDGVVSPDGRLVAFLASRSGPGTRYRTGHPGGPSDVMVLDLRQRRVEVVPGIELAPKSGAGLAWSADGRWLVTALNAGPRTRLLVWRRGWDGPRESPARLPGRVQYSAPVLVTGGRAPG